MSLLAKFAKDVFSLTRRMAHSPERMTMKVVCAWCGELMGYKGGQGQAGITHGICPKCEERIS